MTPQPVPEPDAVLLRRAANRLAKDIAAADMLGPRTNWSRALTGTLGHPLGDLADDTTRAAYSLWRLLDRAATHDGPVAAEVLAIARDILGEQQ